MRNGIFLYACLYTYFPDICKFLSNADNYGKLSSSARKQADKLICRSKTQLQEIIKCRISSNFDATYVDMDPQKGQFFYQLLKFIIINIS